MYIERMTYKNNIQRLFKQHYRQMYRQAVWLLHDEAESKDVVHDVFAQLLQNRSHQLLDDTAEAFLLTCVRNRCLNLMRNRKIQDRIQRLYQLDQQTSILSEQRISEELHDVSEAVRQLQPPVCRDIILRHFNDGLTFSDIAKELQVSETTVYKHLRRALKSLRVKLLISPKV